MKSLKIKRYLASRLATICTAAFLLAAVITAMSDIFDVPALVAKVLPASVVWMYPAVDAFIVLIVGAFAVYLISQLTLERTKMEAELKLKAQLLDAATDSVLLYRSDGSFVYVNEAAYKSRGYSREQLMAMNRRNLAAPEFAGRFDSQLKEIMDKGEKTFESIHLREDGTRMPVEIHACPIEVGGEDLILSICRDITKRKQAQETLRESEERFRSIVENSHDGIMILDDAYRLIYANDELGRISGYSHEEIIGRDFRQFLDEESQQLVAERYVRRQRGEEVPPRYEFNFVHKNSQKRRVEISSSVIKDSAGKVKTVAQILDITERKQAEDLFKTLATSSPIGIYVVQDRAFQFASPQFRELLGYSEDELLGMDSLTPVHPEDREMVRENAIRMLKEGHSSPYEYRYITKSGQCKWVMETVASIQYRGRRATLGNFLDITERKQAEEALQAEKNKLQSVIDAMEDGLNIRDTDYNITYQNEPVRKLYGDRLGEKCYRVYEGEDKVCEGCPVEKAFRDGKSHTAERRVVIPSGEVTFWENTANPIRDARGEVVSCLEITRNITGRKRAEQALVDEATRRRILIDQSRDGIVILDQNGKVYEANQRFAEMLGYSPEEVAQLHVWDWDTQWTREQLLEMFQAVGEAGDYFETCHRRKDGTTIDVEISTNGAVYGDQKLAFCVCRDITGRKQAEEELKLRAQILDGATDSIFLNDLDGNIIYVNEAACKAHGYSREELTNMNVRQLLKPEQSQNFNPADADFQKMLEKGEAVFESAHLRKDGSVMPVEIHGRIIESGGRKLSISVIRDITRRKRAEEELRLRAQILDGATDSIFVHNSEGNFIYVNEAACKAHGYSREELMKMKLQQVIAPDRVSHLDADFQEMREKGEAVFESTHLRKDGSIMPSEVHGRTIESGERKLFLTVIRDITERKRAEEERRELEQRSHLTSRLASIGEMAAGIAHEINNPLTAVIGFSQLLMDTNIPDDIKKDIAIIYKEARRAAEVAKNLLVFARKREPVRQPTAINSAIQEVLKLRAYEQKVNNIQVNTRFAAKLPEVMADYSQLQQVFLNIIINAEAAMLEAHNGGALTITTQQVNGIVKVSFADNGPGIAKENLERVFDPFFTTKEVGKGTGLGLSLCHGIVVQHGGRIYAKSKLGKGATFVVELPTNAN